MRPGGHGANHDQEGALVLDATLPNGYTWERGVTGDWNDPNHWISVNVKPTALDDPFISGEPSLVIVSAGESANTTSLAGGELHIQSTGTLTSPVTMMGGRLTGQGIIIGNVVNNSGTVSPGTPSPAPLMTGIATSASLPGATSVPEPTGCGLILLGFLSWCASPIRRRFQREVVGAANLAAD